MNTNRFYLFFLFALSFSVTKIEAMNNNAIIFVPVAQLVHVVQLVPVIVQPNDAILQDNLQFASHMQKQFGIVLEVLKRNIQSTIYLSEKNQLAEKNRLQYVIETVKTQLTKEYPCLEDMNEYYKNYYKIELVRAYMQELKSLELNLDNHITTENRLL